MEEFTNLLGDLQNNIKTNSEFFEKNVKTRPNIAYLKLNELANFVGKRYSLALEIHFPNKNKILEVSSYGTENLSLVFDKFKKKFQIDRDIIKARSSDFLSKSQVVDAYMYEGKEGLKIILDGDGGDRRIEILPGSLHIWAKVDNSIEGYCNWLLENVYFYKDKKNI